MKLKLYYNRKLMWIDAETIDSLKDLIMNAFSLKADDMSQHLLVRDNRDLLRLNTNPITGCVDLLELADGSILDELDLCKDGDTLVLGWKGPCIVRLVTDFILEEGHNIEVDSSFTIRDLKREIEKLTRETVTENNLPEVLFNGDDDKPLFFFGYYKIRKTNLLPLEIHRSKDSMPVSKYPIMSLVETDADGNKHLIHLRGGNEIDSEDIENEEKREMQYIENQKKKKKKKKKKMNKDIFGKESHPFNKERANIKKKNMKKNKKKIMKHEEK